MKILKNLLRVIVKDNFLLYMKMVYGNIGTMDTNQIKQAVINYNANNE